METANKERYLEENMGRKKRLRQKYKRNISYVHTVGHVRVIYNYIICVLIYTLYSVLHNELGDSFIMNLYEFNEIFSDCSETSSHNVVGLTTLKHNYIHTVTDTHISTTYNKTYLIRY